MAYKKLGDTKMYSSMVTLINAMGKTMVAKNDPEAAVFKHTADGWIAQYGNILNFPIAGSENDEPPEWWETFLLTLADKFTDKDFIKHKTLGLALSSLILCFTEIKKPKPWEELLYVDISEAVDGFEDFIVIKEDDDVPTPSGAIEEDEPEVESDDVESDDDVEPEPEEDGDENA